MNRNELEKLFFDFEKKLNKSPPEFDLFLSEPGKIFQKEIDSLMKIIVSNLIPALPGILEPFLKNARVELGDNLDKNIHFELENSDSLIQNQTMKLGVFLTDIINSIKPNKETISLISDIVTRINSYYILSLFAYMDHYIDSIHKEILSKYRDETCIEFFDSFRRTKPNPQDVLDKIRNKLDLGEIDKITELPVGKPWSDSFTNMWKLRHEFAHKNPKASREIFNEKFKRISGAATKKLNTIFSNPENQNSTNEFISEITEIVRPNFEAIFILEQIGKEVSGYLAVYDHLVTEFFSKNNPI